MVASINSNAASAFSNALFDKVDTKKQGYIDAGELSTALGSDASAVFKKIDSDNDGKISKSELSAATEKVFSALKAQQHEGQVHKGGRGGGGKPEGAPPPPPPQSAASQTSDPADTNQDGTVSQAEQAAYDSKAQAQPQQHFEHALSLLKAYFDDAGSSSSTSQVSATA